MLTNRKGMMKLCLQIVLLSVILSADVWAFEKVWKWKNQWNVGEFWEGGKVPCPNDAIVISDGTLFVGSNVSASSVDFGNNGEIVFDDNSEIVISDDSPAPSSPDQQHCDTSVSQSRFVGQPSSKDFLNPLNWEISENGIVDKDLTTAAPYMNRIPCQEDTATFPMSNTFKVKLSNDWSVLGVTINNQALTNSQLQSYIQSNPSEFEMVSGASFTSNNNYACARSGCLCGYQKFKESVCQKFTCPVPTITAGCSTIVRPHGDCCSRCGKLITFDTLDVGFDFQKCWAVFTGELSKQMRPETLKYVKFYMSRINGQQVQITLTEIESTNADSAASTELAVKILQTAIQNGISACFGSNLIIDRGTQPNSGGTGTDGGSDDDSSNDGLKIAIGIIIPVLILVIVIIVVFAYRRRREPYDVPKVRFKNNEELEFPGGTEGQYSTMGNTNLAIDMEPDGAYNNPTYEINDLERGNVRKHEMREFPYEIPLNDEPPPSYTEKDSNLGVTTIGDLNQMYAQVNKFDDEIKEKVDFPDDDLSSLHKEPLDDDAFLKDEDINEPPPFEKSVIKLDDHYNR